MKKGFSIILVILLALSCNDSLPSSKKMEFNSDLGMIKSDHAIQDISHLFERLEKVHYNPYLHIPQELLFEKIEAVRRSWAQRDSIQKTEFIIASMQLLSLVEDGHSKIVWYSTTVLPRRDSIQFFPFHMKQDQQKMWLRNSASPELLDQEVIAINGIDANMLYEDALHCLSGNLEHKNEIASNLFFPIYLYLKGVTAPYTIELKPQTQLQADGSDLASFLDLYKRLQPSSSNYEYQFLEKEKIGLITYNSCTDYDAFKVFLDSTFKKINQVELQDLIIDIRNNSGGDSSLNDLLIAYITKKAYRQSSKRLWKLSEVSLEELVNRGAKEYYGEDFANRYRLESDTSILDFKEDELPQKPDPVDHFFRGEAYVLIGSKTYSSANMFADAISTYNLATLVGKPTGERTNDFGEQKTELLPLSKIPFDFTIAYDIGADGDETSVKTVEPDLEVNEDALKYTIDLILKKRENQKAK